MVFCTCTSFCFTTYYPVSRKYTITIIHISSTLCVYICILETKDCVIGQRQPNNVTTPSINKQNTMDNKLCNAILH